MTRLKSLSCSCMHVCEIWDESRGSVGPWSGRFRPSFFFFFWMTTAPFPNWLSSGSCSLSVTVVRSRSCDSTCCLGKDHDNIFRLILSTITQKRVTRTSMASFHDTASIPAAPPDCYSITAQMPNPPTKVVLIPTTHCIAGGGSRGDCQVVIRSRRRRESRGQCKLGLRCILCRRGGHDNIVRSLRRKMQWSPANDSPSDSRRATP